MKRVVRGAISFLVVALALANTGCGSKSSERSATSPTSSRPTASGDEGWVTSTAYPPLGTVDQFAVLAGAGVTTALQSVTITGDVGSSPIGAGAQPAGMTVTGTYFAAANAVTAQAQLDVTNMLVANLAGQPATAGSPLLVQLGGAIVTPGVYDFVGGAASTADIAATTTLQLSGNGSYVFRVGTALTANVGSNVVLTNGANPCDVFWLVGTAATISGLNFPGTVIAGAGVTVNSGSNTVNIGANGIRGGRVISRTASVSHPGTLAITEGGCSGFVPAAGPTPTPAPGGPVPALPAAAAWGLLAILLASGAFILSRH